MESELKPVDINKIRKNNLGVPDIWVVTYQQEIKTQEGAEMVLSFLIQNGDTLVPYYRPKDLDLFQGRRPR